MKEVRWEAAVKDEVRGGSEKEEVKQFLDNEENQRTTR